MTKWKPQPVISPADLAEAKRRNQLLSKAAELVGVFTLRGVQLRIRLLHEALEHGRLPIGRHTHDTYELSFMTAGAMEYLVGERRVVIEAGSGGVFCVPPETEHRRVPLTSPIVVSGFQLKVAAERVEARDFVESLPERVLAGGCLFEAKPRLRAIRDAWDDEIESPGFMAQLSLSLLAREFLLQFLRDSFADDLKSLETGIEEKGRFANSGHMAMKMTEYIDEHLSERLPLKSISRNFGLSERHVNRLFVNAVGMPLGAFIVQRKMRQAAWELRDTDRLVKTIASELGYDDLGHFSKVFAKHHGTSPKRFRGLQR